MRIAIPTRGKRKLANKVAETFSRAPNFTIVTVENDKIKDVMVIDNPGKIPKRGAGPLAASVLKDNRVNLLLTGEMGPGARDILEAFDINIEIVQEGRKVIDVIEPYIASL